MLNANQHMLDYVDDYLHETLAPPDALALEHHCEKCTICQAALAEAQKRFDALQTVPAVEASERLVSRSVQQIETKVRRGQRRWKVFSRSVFYATAASILIIGGLNVHYLRLAPSPYEVRVLGQDQLLAGAPAGLRVGVFEHGSGAAVAGVPIRIALYNPRTAESVVLASFTTGSEDRAAARLQLPDWQEGNYELQITASPDGRDETHVESIELKRSWKLMVSTDKPIYQPGQTIHLRSLALRRPDLKPLTGQEVIFTITDPKGNVIFKQHDVTSSYGITSADCPLARQISQGAYQIECRVGEVVSNRTVEVFKYVLPKFKVALQLDKSYYAPGQQVKVTVDSRYFFGEPVAGADVEIEARAVDFASYEIHRDTAKTDHDGAVTFTFRLPNEMIGREQDNGNARFELAAQVTDTAGQSYSSAATRIVTQLPVQLSVIAESGTLVRGQPNVIYVYAGYVDGRAAQVKVVMNDQQQTTNALGVAAFTLAVAGVDEVGDEVGLTFKASDQTGRVLGRKHVTLAYGNYQRDFVLRTDRAVYSSGDTMTLTALGGGVEPLFIDLIKDGQTVLTQTLDLAGGKGQVAIDLPADLFGVIRLVSYRFGDAGLAVRKERTIVVRQAGEIRIEARLDRDQYRPGEMANLTIQLSDADGNPTAGAVSLAAVDEAVFSVLAQSAGLEQAFFLLEQQLLEPVYAIYQGWTPQRAVPGVEPVDLTLLEQALFSGTARTVAGRDAVPVGFTQRAEVTESAEFEFDVVGAEVDIAVPVGVADGGDAGESPFTLAVNNYAAKKLAITARRQGGLFGVAVAWCLLGGLLVLVAVGTFAVYRPLAFVITAAATFIGLVALGVPALILAFFVMSAAPRAGEFANFDAVAAQALGGEGWAVLSDIGDEEMSAPGGEQFPSATEPSEQSGGVADNPAAPRLRRHFPETLLWRPELIADETGTASLTIPLADSITTWRLSASAVNGNGQLGSDQFSIRVFQPFFVDLDLPVALTRNDEVGVRIVVHNHLDRPQSVQLVVEEADWYERLDGTDTDNGGEPLTLELGAKEVRPLILPIRVLRVGHQQLQVTATSGELSDAIVRTIEVVPDGRRVEQLVSGTLDQPLKMELTVPTDAIPGSAKTIVKLHPSSFSQLVEGLDAIFQMPYGCFEQTSSTTYPNVLALDYLRRTGTDVPVVEAKARQYIHVGYQRLVSFEVAGGGFDWFGNPPANRTLTAYGLMEFDDMAGVYDVDTQVIQRTRAWLLSQRAGDGSWPAEVGMLNDGLAGSVQRGDVDLSSTAYIAWAVFGGGQASDVSRPTLDFLLAHEPATIDDPYVLAVVISAIAAIDSDHAELNAYLDRLHSLKQSSPDGKLVWWQQPQGGRTTFYGSGQAGNIETTAMASLALMDAGRYPASTRGALNWLIEQKDASGTWHSTQATVLSLKALLAGTGKPLGEESRRTIEISLGGEVVETIDIAADQADVTKQIDLSHLVSGGTYQLSIRETTDTGTGFQVALEYHVQEETPAQQPQQPLSIDIVYDRQRLQVDDTVTAVASVTNNMQQVAPMVILDLPIPGGFSIEPAELDELVGSKQIEKYQITARKAIVYLRSLAPGAQNQLQLRYRLRATMPVKVAVPPGQAYEYYDPAKRGSGGAAQLEALIEA